MSESIKLLGGRVL